MKKKYNGPIKKNEIYDYMENNENKKEKQAVEKIQKLKEDITQRLFSELKPIDIPKFQEAESDYLKALEGKQEVNVFEDDIYKEKINFEKIFKNEKDPSYVERFKIVSSLCSKYWDEDIHELKNLLNDDILSPEEKMEIQKFLKIARIESVKNTWKRKIYFDYQILEDKKFRLEEKFNIPCFFEQDEKWNKNFLSLNALLKDLQSFWQEIGYPQLTSELSEEYKKFFPSVQRRIKMALSKNFLSYYRDQQEVLMYDFLDYEKKEWNLKNKKWFATEQVVERMFRHFANLDQKYKIDIQKASIWEDQRDKVDLIIKIQNKQSKISIEKELQITTNTSPNVLKKKRKQIKQRHNNWNNLELVRVELENIERKLNIWQKLKRPVWWLQDLLSIEDKKFLKETYNRLVDELKDEETKV